jgi:subtilisin family serine protease
LSFPVSSRMILACVASLPVIFSGGVAAAVESPPKSDFRYILQSSNAPDVIDDASSQLRLSSSLAPFNLAIGASLVTLEDASQEEASLFLTALEADGRVSFVEEDLLALPSPGVSRSKEAESVVKAQDIGSGFRRESVLEAVHTPEDPFRWNLVDFGIPSYWDHSRGKGAVVAIVDTGWQPHQALVHSVLPGADLIRDIPAARDGDGRDMDPFDEGDWTEPEQCGVGGEFSPSTFHGTVVGGAVAGNSENPFGFAGVSPEVGLVPVRVSGPCGARTSDVADGIVWAAGGEVEGLPRNENPADVINVSLSLERSCSPAYQQAIDRARDLGAQIVVAAGNFASDAGSFSPGNCAGVVNVGGTNTDGDIAVLSNFGSGVDIFGPSGDWGDDVVTPAAEGLRQAESFSYRYRGGTSVAAAHVTGALALLAAGFPSLSAEERAQVLVETARVKEDAHGRGEFRVLDVAGARSFLEQEGVFPGGGHSRLSSGGSSLRPES